MMTKRRSKSLANLKLMVILPVISMLMLAFSDCPEQEQFTVKKGENLAEMPPPPPPPPVPGDGSIITEKSSRGDVASEPYVVVEQMPMFPGGEQSLLDHLSGNINYPQSAADRGIQGKVIIRFSVDADGRVSRESVLKGVDPLLDEEALRVVKMLPRFDPGRQGGKAVPVWYMVPINFTLK